MQIYIIEALLLVFLIITTVCVIFCKDILCAAVIYSEFSFCAVLLYLMTVSYTHLEGEQFDGAEVRAAVAEYAAPLKAAGIDTLILSCTHYPFIQKEIESEFGSEVTVIDPADATAQDTKTVLAAEGLLRSEGAGTLEVCFTADVERGARIAGRVLPQGKCLFKEIKL